MSYKQVASLSYLGGFGIVRHREVRASRICFYRWVFKLYWSYEKLRLRFAAIERER